MIVLFEIFVVILIGYCLLVGLVVLTAFWLVVRAVVFAARVLGDLLGIEQPGSC